MQIINKKYDMNLIPKHLACIADSSLTIYLMPMKKFVQDDN